MGALAVLSQRLAESAPGVEAVGKGMLLVALADQAQAAWLLMLFGSHVLDVHLAGLQTQFDLHLACLDFLSILFITISPKYKTVLGTE